MKVLRLEGLSPYTAVHHLQEQLVALRAADEVPDVLLMLEHPETITLGRKKGSEASVLLADDVPVVRVERGGDATYHAPGQLVGYPIVKLGEGEQDLWAVLRHMEEALIEVLEQRTGLKGHRDDRNTGVWLTNPDGFSLKVCSMGIACRKWVTWHGLALNLDVDLAGFARIRPCGFGAEVMTRVADHHHDVELQDWVGPVAQAVTSHLGRPWDGELVNVTVSSVEDADAVLQMLQRG